jgi:hypothetical protein
MTPPRKSPGVMAVVFIAIGTLLAWGTAPAQTFSDQSDLFNLEGALDDAAAAWGDYNNDGWVDLMCRHQLFRSVNGTGFTLVQTLYPGNIADYDIWGDYDDDGYLDLVSWVGSAPQKLKILHNNAGSGFTEIVLPTLPADLAHAGAAAWGDFDGDGHIDLYVSGERNNQNHGEPDVILTNVRDAQGSFSHFEVTWEEPDPQGPEKIKPGRGVIACDFDQDGDLDIHVSNYWAEKNYLWLNDGEGHFADVADARHVNDIPDKTQQGYTIGSAWGDLDNDGDFDLFEANLSHYPASQKVSSFYRNNGDQLDPLLPDYDFTDMTAGAGLAWQESFDTPTLGDYDNDGDLDLYLTVAYSTGGNHSVLYRNDGAWHFVDVTSSVGFITGDVPPAPLIINTPQAAWADFDKDGDLDLVTGGDPLTGGKLFVNSGNSNHWIELKLTGPNGVGNVIGAQVRVTAPNITGTLTRQVEAGTGQANQNDMTLHFGLGLSNGPLTVKVIWPDGTPTCEKTSIGANQLCAINYPCTETCQEDTDGDGSYDAVDNCPTVANANQADEDEDGDGDVCDNCRWVENPTQADSDGDGDGNACDNCPAVANSNQADTDGDGVGNVCDNCVNEWNPTQTDTDQDGLGDACDAQCNPYCEGEGFGCTFAYYGPGNCCAYTCGSMPSCTGTDPLPPNICH